MNLGVRTIQAYISPIFEAHGYYLKQYDKKSAYFQNKNGTVKIGFLLSKHLPGELLDCYLSGYETEKWILPPYAFFMDFTVVIGRKPMSMNPSTSRKPIQPFATFVFSSEDIKKAAESFAARALQEWLPSIEAVAEHGVYPDLQMYQELSICTKERANRFSKKVGSSLSATLTSLRNVKEHMNGLIPECELEYSSQFQRLRGHFLDMAAFLGESMAEKFSGEWRWYELSKEFPDLDDLFCVHIPGDDDTMGGFNPLYYTIMHWNLSPIANGFGFDADYFTKYFAVDADYFRKSAD